MKLFYNNKSINVYECRNFFSRLRGFMFQQNINKALLFNCCNSIHTFFMKENIDVIMCDKGNNILFYYHDIGKNKVILPKKNVYKVIELPVDYFDIKIGTKIEIIN